jgi:hypothetical protein
MGGGAFAPAVAYSAEWFGCGECDYLHTAIDAADLDNDGDADIVVGAAYVHNYVVLRNGGDGAFGPVELHDSFGSGFDGAWVMKLRDLNGDGWRDVASLTMRLRAGLRVNLNDGRGAPITPEPAPAVEGFGKYLNAQWVEAADLDLDGDMDLVEARWDQSEGKVVRVLAGDGLGDSKRSCSFRHRSARRRERSSERGT